MKDRKKALEDSLIRTITLTTLLVDELDELGKHRLYRHRLKRTGNQFKKELEKQVDDVWKSGNKKDAEEMSKNTDKVAKVAREFDKAIKNIL